MENKKKYLLLLLLLLLLIGGGFFIFKSCEPRLKPPEEGVVEEEFDELSAFINANIEFTCEVIKNPELQTDKVAAEERVNAAYAKYGLPVEDDTRMIDILKKYDNDTEVISIVKTNIKPCLEGGDPIFYQNRSEA